MDRTLKLNPHARPALSDADVYKAMERLGAYVDITPADFRAIYEDAWTIARQKLLDEVTAGDMMSALVSISTAFNVLFDNPLIFINILAES